MQVVELPRFSPSDSVEEAIAALREWRRSAIVLEDGEETYLIFGGPLASAQQQGALVLSQVAEREALSGSRLEDEAQEEDADDGLQRQLLFGISDKIRRRVSGAWLPNDQEYAILSSEGRMARVAAHEWSYEILTLPGVYVCDRDATHKFPRPRVSDGDPCQKCKVAPDGSRGTVRLS